MNTQQADARRLLLAALKRQAGKESQGLLRRTAGICSAVYHEVVMAHSDTDIAVDVLMHKLFKQWPSFSGNSSFPITLPDAEDAGGLYFKTDDKWDRDTEYGRNRWALVDWMIAQLESESDSEVVS